MTHDPETPDQPDQPGQPEQPGQAEQPEQPDQAEQSDQPDVGSVGEEAAKLLGALSDWAKDTGGDAGAGLGATLSGLAGHAAERLGEVNEHLATGAPECTYCPVCRTVHAVRETSPEVKAHLLSAASSFLQAVSGVLASTPAAPGTGSPGGRGASGGTSGGASGSAGLQRIDLDGDDGDDGDDD